MGTDLDQYVHPERVSSQLICPICTQVLKNPVQTSTDHLFCEDELLEWMTRSNLCPVSKRILDPSKITKPSRIIVNMLAELEIYCSNRAEGCKWSGPHDRLDSHLSICAFIPRSALIEEAMSLKSRIEELESTVAKLEDRNDFLLEENRSLKETIEEYRQKLRVFHALLSSESEGKILDDSDLEDDFKEMEKSFELDNSSEITDVERLRNIRNLRSMTSNGDDGRRASHK